MTHPNASNRKKFFWSPEERISLDLPENYQEYDKSAEIGKIADWIRNKRKKENYKSTRSNLPDSIYSPVLENDETLSDSLTTGKFESNFIKNRSKYVPNKSKEVWKKRRVVFGSQKNWNTGRNNNEKNRFRSGNRYNSNYWFRRASVAVKDEWKLIEDFPYTELSKLATAKLPQSQDIYDAGAVLEYNRSFDSINPKESCQLSPCNFIFNKESTSKDEIIRANYHHACIYATDSILSTLMTCTRSVAPWDIMIYRVENKLFFDKRSESDIELFSVNETARDPGFDHGINSPSALNIEATIANQYYSQQCLLKNTLRKMKHDNPFFEEDKSRMPSVAYKYRIFDFGSDMKILVRCEYDAYSKQDSKNVNVKSLLEWGNKKGMFNWRETFETQRGSILATEIKNNYVQFAKWAASALMAGGNLLKIGLISRNQFSDNTKHSIIGSININSMDLSFQIGLNMQNAWGIIYTLSQKLLNLPEGRYILMKDPYKNSLKLYFISDDFTDTEDESQEDDDEQDTKSKEDFNDTITFENLY